MLVFFTQVLSAQCPTNIIFSTQGEVDSFPINYPDCTGFWGDVTIRGYGITGLDSLYPIQAVAGGLYLDSTSVVDLDGLENLSSVNTSVNITNNPALVSLLKMPKSESQVKIHNNDALTNLNGVPLMSSYGDTYVSDNDALESMVGLVGTAGNLYITDNDALLSLDSVIFVGFRLVVSGNKNLTSLGSLSSVGLLAINHNESLTCLCGLEGMTTVALGLYVSDNPSLTSVDGVENLVTIGGELSFVNNNLLTDLTPFASLSAIGGALEISDNDILESLEGLENINPLSISASDINSKDLIITNNPLLSNCGIENICELISLPTTKREIHDNATGCNDSLEISDACLVGYEPTLTSDKVTVYPNPAKGKISIMGLEYVDNVLIYSLLGELVLAQKELSIDVFDFPKGLYWVEISQGERKWFEKLVIE